MGIRPDDAGLIDEVHDGGEAQAKGIKAGDRILKVGSEEFSKDRLLAKIGGGEEYIITVDSAWTKYDGEWVNDKHEGQGTGTKLDGSRYCGEWKDGKEHGTGAPI